MSEPQLPRQIQLRLTQAQIDRLEADCPPGLSVHQAAKWLVLQKLDPPAAAEMLVRAREGKRRLTA